MPYLFQLKEDNRAIRYSSRRIGVGELKGAALDNWFSWGPHDLSVRKLWAHASSLFHFPFCSAFWVTLSSPFRLLDLGFASVLPSKFSLLIRNVALEEHWQTKREESVAWGCAALPSVMYSTSGLPPAEDEHFSISFLLPPDDGTFLYFIEKGSSILKREIKSFGRKQALEQTKSSFFTTCSALLFVQGKQSGYLRGCVQSHLCSRIVEIQTS